MNSPGLEAYTEELEKWLSGSPPTLSAATVPALDLGPKRARTLLRAGGAP